jgi:hypothetical protein
MPLMSVAVGKAAEDEWAEEACRAMPLDVGRRSVEFGNVWLRSDINLHRGEVVIYLLHSRT